jgi:hypothetical protein
MMLRLLVSAGFAALLAAPALAQDIPDLSGTWDNGGGIGFLRPQDLGGGNICVTGCPPTETGAAPAAPAARPAAAAPNIPQYRPEHQAKVADLTERQVEEDPVLRCLPPGVPRIGPPDKIVQATNELVFLYEDVSGPFFRMIPIGGEHHDDIDPAYHGDSVGRWEGDTLVVETVNFTDDTWLTDNGAFHSEGLRVVEELRLTEDGRLEWVATAYDDGVLAEPWRLNPRVSPRAEWEIVESPPCVERSLGNMVDGTYHANPR